MKTLKGERMLMQMAMRMASSRPRSGEISRSAMESVKASLAHDVGTSAASQGDLSDFQAVIPCQPILSPVSLPLGVLNAPLTWH